MRRFLSILLVVLLLFSLLAVPASAMSAGAVVASYGGVEAVSAIISGLGLTIDSLEKFDAWNTLVSSASEYLTAQNIIDSVGTIAALKSGSKIYFPSSVVQSVRDWILSSDYIETSVSGVFNDALGNSYSYSGPSTFLQYMYDNGSSSGSSRRFSVLILISVFSGLMLCTHGNHLFSILFWKFVSISPLAKEKASLSPLFALPCSGR